LGRSSCFGEPRILHSSLEARLELKRMACALTDIGYSTTFDALAPDGHGRDADIAARFRAVKPRRPSRLIHSIANTSVRRP